MVQARLVANFLLFQLGWVVAVVGAARGYPLAGVVYALVFVFFHLLYMRGGRVPELLLVLGSAIFGFLVDSLLVLSGMIEFPAHSRLGYPSTVWMASLWLMFAMTLRHSLGWLRGRYVLAAALGAVFGPLAYWAGSRIGAIHLSGGGAAVAAVAVAWTASMIVLLRLELATRPPDGAGRVRQGDSV